MVKNRLNKAWEFEIKRKETGLIIKSWFYGDTEEDARDRLENYMNSEIISLKEIVDPLKIIRYDDSVKEKTSKTKK